MQHVIQAIIFSCSFDAEDVLWIRDDADHTAVSPVTGADRADFMIGVITANAAAFDFFFSCTNRIGKGNRLFIRKRQDIKCQTLCALASNPWKRSKTINQIIKGCREKSHKIMLLPNIILRESCELLHGGLVHGKQHCLQQGRRPLLLCRPVRCFYQRRRLPPAECRVPFHQRDGEAL